MNDRGRGGFDFNHRDPAKASVKWLGIMVVAVFVLWSIVKSVWFEPTKKIPSVDTYVPPTEQHFCDTINNTHKQYDELNRAYEQETNSLERMHIANHMTAVLETRNKSLKELMGGGDYKFQGWNFIFKDISHSLVSKPEEWNLYVSPSCATNTQIFGNLILLPHVHDWLSTLHKGDRVIGYGHVKEYLTMSLPTFITGGDPNPTYVLDFDKITNDMAEPINKKQVPSAPNATFDFQRTLLLHLDAAKRYPHEAQLRHEQGTVYLRFRMDRSGRVLSAVIDRSSGYPDLDAEVLDMINRAQPLPPIPPEIAQSQLELVAPVRFSLR